MLSFTVHVFHVLGRVERKPCIPTDWDRWNRSNKLINTPLFCQGLKNLTKTIAVHILVIQNNDEGYNFSLVEAKCNIIDTNTYLLQIVTAKLLNNFFYLDIINYSNYYFSYHSLLYSFHFHSTLVHYH